MCEQSTIQYLDGDIVWVKLGSCWWPGEVQDLKKLPEDVANSLQKEPIAAVKFFNEDKYEFVKNLEHIYKYNCRRKHEFIKKGLDMHRKKNTFMVKFPEDISHAEKATGGDPDIIHSKEFGPEKKIDYAAIFGQDTPKKSPKTPGSARGLGRPSLNSAKQRSSLSSSTTPVVQRHITHPRFIGYNDHEVLYRVQRSSPPPTEVNSYKCYTCGFESTRQNVIILHNKSHINGTYISFSTSKKSPIKKIKKTKPKSTSNNKDDTVKPLKKREIHTTVETKDEEKKQEVTKSPKRKAIKTPSPLPKKTKVNIKDNILSDWGFDESEDENSCPKDSEEKETKDGDEVSVNKDDSKSKESDSADNDLSKSCFDFVEEEDPEIIHNSPGRKIPRVIPQNQKRKSLETEVETEGAPEVTTDKKATDVDDNPEENGEVETNDITTAIDDLLETTKVPEIPQLLKSEKNFHEDKTIKFPDKQELNADTKPSSPAKHLSETPKSPKAMLSPKSPKAVGSPKSPKAVASPKSPKAVASPKSPKSVAVSPKIQNPKKRFIKSIEIFESSDIEKGNDNDELADTCKVSSLKSQLMTKLNDKPSSVSETKRETRRSSRLSGSSHEVKEDKQEEKKPKVTEALEVEGSKKLETNDKSAIVEMKSVAKNESIVEEKDSNAAKIIKESSATKLSTLQTTKDNSIPEAAKPTKEKLQTVDEAPEKIVAIEEESKPVTLSSFSMDFSDSNNDSTSSIPSAEPTVPTQKDEKLKTEKSEIPPAVIKKDVSKKIENIVAAPAAVQKETSKKPEVVPKTKETQPPPPLQESVSEIPDLEDLIPKSTLDLNSSVSVTNKNEHASGEAEKKAPYTVVASKLFDMLKKSNETKENKEEVIVKKSPIVTAIPSTTNVLLKGTRKYEKVVPKGAEAYKSIMSTKKVVDPKMSNFVVKSQVSPKTSNLDTSSKPIILSDKIIKPVVDTQKVSVQKVTSKRTYQDVEDIDTFIIQKPAKKPAPNTDAEESNVSVGMIKQTPSRSRGKANILQQTIITPSGEVIQPDLPRSKALVVDDNMFDINSMPILLSDDMLTPQSIETMQVITEMPMKVEKAKPPVTLLNKSGSKVQSDATIVKSSPNTMMKNVMAHGLTKNQKIYQTSASKLMKNSTAVITQPGKPGKFVIVPSGSTPPPGTKYTVGKRTPLLKAAPTVQTPPKPKPQTQSIGEEASGNKIVIVTNQQGVQSRMILTPSHQKLLTTPVKVGQKGIKGGVVHSKSILTSKGTILSPVSSTAVTNAKNTVLTHTLVHSKGQLIGSPNLMTSEGQPLTPMALQQYNKNLKQTPKGIKMQPIQQRILVPDPVAKVKMSPTIQKTRTILIKNQQGQIIKKVTAPDDSISNPDELKRYYMKQGLGEEISQTLANQKQQLLPPKRMTPVPPKPEIKPQITKTVQHKQTPKRSYAKKSMPEVKQKQVMLSPSIGKQQPEVVMPPLAPISATKKSDSSALSESLKQQNVLESLPGSSTDADKISAGANTTPQKPLNQLVIQDAMGNQTTVTEGQILALPSDAVDGQPQSYMLVTLDESGNLTPLNNEALLSLDPSLGLGGDLSNVVLQIDQGKDGEATVVQSQAVATAKSAATPADAMLTTANYEEQTIQSTNKDQHHIALPGVDQSNAAGAYMSDAATTSGLEQTTVTCSINSDPTQQLIITGDPISTQKFLESLTEGNADISNLLANAEGNIIINADGQQILINADSDANHQLLLSVGADSLTSSQLDHNPVMGSTSKSQDIIAAALAGTDVQDTSTIGVTPATESMLQELSSMGYLYPSSISNVLETSLTLGSPIMTPLEVPSVTTKKVSELETNLLSQVPKCLELPITITDPNISQTVAQHQNLSMPDTGISTASDMNYVYSLPSLDENTVQMSSTCSSSISMPLLTEEPEPKVEETSLPIIEDKPAAIEETSEKKESKSPQITSEPAASDSPSDEIPDKYDELRKSPRMWERDRMRNIREEPTASNSPTDEMPVKYQEFHKPSRMWDRPHSRSTREEPASSIREDLCNSLSEPPPDLFEIIFKDVDTTTNTNVSANATEIAANAPDEPLVSESSQLTDSDNIGSTFGSFGDESSNNQTPLLNLTPNSELNSPRTNFDENSCEIPIQPPIVTTTDLAEQLFHLNNGSDTTMDSMNKKRPLDDSEKDNDDEAAKKTKLD